MKCCKARQQCTDTLMKMLLMADLWPAVQLACLLSSSSAVVQRVREDRCSSRSVLLCLPGFCDVQWPPMFALLVACSAKCLAFVPERCPVSGPGGEMGWDGMEGGGRGSPSGSTARLPGPDRSVKNGRVGKLRRWTQLAAICADF